VDPVTGKFTNGDFSDPFKKPSFVPAETVNLIPDNLANLITAPGGTPDNFSVNQLRDAVGGRLIRAGGFTFVVDSNEALAAWADNTAGNDYSRVLIKAGTWTRNIVHPGGGFIAPLTGIDLSDGRTMSVVGEAGSRIVINSSGGGFHQGAGIRGNATVADGGSVSPGTDFFFHNVNVHFHRSGVGSGFAFWGCATLVNCTGSGSGGGAGHGIGGFRDCVNLINCSGIGGEAGDGAAGFFNCTDLTSCIGTGGPRSLGHGFLGCVNLATCTGGGGGAGFRECRFPVNCIGSSNGTGAGFAQCRTGFGNRRGVGASGAATFDRCLMAQGAGNPSTNDWANTAEGGWNDPGVSPVLATLDMSPDGEDALSENAAPAEDLEHTAPALEDNRRQTAQGEP